MLTSRTTSTSSDNPFIRQADAICQFLSAAGLPERPERARISRGYFPRGPEKKRYGAHTLCLAGPPASARFFVPAHHTAAQRRSAELETRVGPLQHCFRPVRRKTGCAVAAPTKLHPLRAPSIHPNRDVSAGPTPGDKTASSAGGQRTEERRNRGWARKGEASRFPWWVGGAPRARFKPVPAAETLQDYRVRNPLKGTRALALEE